MKKKDGIDITHPLIADEWHPTKNGTILASEVTAGSGKVAWWQGVCGHEWDTKTCIRTGQRQKCPICSNKRILIGYNDLATTFPMIATEWHPTKNGDVTTYMAVSGSRTDYWWLGKCGHEWYTTPNIRTHNNAGCPYCANQKTLTGVNDLETMYPLLAELWDYEKNEASGHTPSTINGRSKISVWWKCELGHSWKNRVCYQADKLTYCTTCYGRTILPGFNDLATKFPELMLEWHPTKNTVDPTTISAETHDKAWWICSAKGHEHLSSVRNRTKYGIECKRCTDARYISKAEQEIADWLVSLGCDVKQGDKTVLKGLELDILVRDKNVAIEYNGIYWHSDANIKDKHYHRKKWLDAKNAGIQLIQVWEDEWLAKPDVVKSMIAHKLGLNVGERVFARKTSVVAMDTVVAKAFFDEHHIQGYASGSYYYGLAGEDGNIVSAIALKRQSGNCLNIVRYASAVTVVGGFTKLLRHVERNVAVDRFITFSDNCVSDGGLYANNGFVVDKELPVDYRYVVGLTRAHKFGYRLKKFRDDPLLKWQDGLPESQLAKLNGLARIWDAGKTRWVREVS